jgi:peptidoglycan hydrolase-like protein with peptidoglycan-binding domain
MRENLTMKITYAFALALLLAGCSGHSQTTPGEESVPAAVEAPALAPQTLHRHEMGTHGMRSLQHALTAKGYYHGRIDGRDGPQTKKAVARYQQDLGVTPTGDVDEQTWSSLGLSEGH